MLVRSKSTRVALICHASLKRFKDNLVTIYRELIVHFFQVIMVKYVLEQVLIQGERIEQIKGEWLPNKRYI